MHFPSARRSWILMGLLLGPLCAPFAQRIVVTPAGGWNAGTFDATQITDGLPGNDFALKSTASDYVDIDLSSLQRNRNWRVWVVRSAAGWDPDLKLYIRRTTDGTGNGTITGGTSDLEITTTETPFFWGVTGNSTTRTDVKAQLTLEASVATVAPQNYSTTVTYRVERNY